MPVSDRWTQVDAINRPYNLDTGDYCYYLNIYSAYAGYTTPANQLLLNYKIRPSVLRSNPAREGYKDAAIKTYVDALIGFFEALRFTDGKPITSVSDSVGLVPAPPSHTPGDSDYDDRNVRVCRAVSERFGFRLCRDIEMGETIQSAHSGGTRDPNVLASHMKRSSFLANGLDYVFVVDDTLTTGGHFKAVRIKLESTGYKALIIGLFLARAV